MQECIFCKIIKGDLPCKKIYEDENLLAFYDLNPAASKHGLVIPKKHISSLAHLNKNDSEVMGNITCSLNKIAVLMGLDNGFKTIVNTGKNGGQKVFHIHYHILGGKIKTIDF